MVIYTNCGKEIKISDEDYPALMFCRWSYNKRTGYIKESTSMYRNDLLHRIIARRMKLDMTNDIDYIDRNKLNNERNNLRAATKSQNSANNRDKGVYYDKSWKKYVAQITVNNKAMHLGGFISAKGAARAYNIAATKYFGKFARLNIIT